MSVTNINPRQLRTIVQLTGLGPGHDIQVRGLANPGEPGPLWVGFGRLPLVVAEDGVCALAEPEAIQAREVAA
jgi:hypothetical protein